MVAAGEGRQGMSRRLPGPPPRARVVVAQGRRGRQQARCTKAGALAPFDGRAVRLPRSGALGPHSKQVCRMCCHLLYPVLAVGC